MINIIGINPSGKISKKLSDIFIYLYLIIFISILKEFKVNVKRNYVLITNRIYLSVKFLGASPPPLCTQPQNFFHESADSCL